jgi:hypothetical protein
LNEQLVIVEDILEVRSFVEFAVLDPNKSNDEAMDYV